MFWLLKPKLFLQGLHQIEFLGKIQHEKSYLFLEMFGERTYAADIESRTSIMLKWPSTSIH